MKGNNGEIAKTQSKHYSSVHKRTWPRQTRYLRTVKNERKLKDINRLITGLAVKQVIFNKLG